MPKAFVPAASQRRRDTSMRGCAERSASSQLSGERRGAASESFSESPTSCTEYRSESSAPKAFVPAALNSGRRAGNGAPSTDPAKAFPPREPVLLRSQDI